MIILTNLQLHLFEAELGVIQLGKHNRNFSLDKTNVYHCRGNITLLLPCQAAHLVYKLSNYIKHPMHIIIYTSLALFSLYSALYNRFENLLNSFGSGFWGRFGGVFLTSAIRGFSHFNYSALALATLIAGADNLNIVQKHGINTFGTE
jgi:hypothetical protein